MKDEWNLRDEIIYMCKHGFAVKGKNLNKQWDNKYFFPDYVILSLLSTLRNKLIKDLPDKKEEIDKIFGKGSSLIILDNE